uniref:Uncharacterized protein n=1 Tax=uncultured Prochlorococcus marinus clone ASNC1092 TaxID=379363 RepID=Q1PLC8_PROMR|nr:hypothetical protein ASNC1092_0031 [uncultured Prochlorococcus marinus clone ASNC1092]
MDIEKTKSDFSELMKEFSWEAPTYDIYQANRDPLEKDIFNVEGDDPSEIFVRELIQNSLDAKLKTNNDPVHLELEVIDFNHSNLRSSYQKIVNPKIQKYLYSSKDITQADVLTYKALRISDFNTTGLDGKSNDETSNWYKYFYKIGDKGKLSKKDGLGSANLGKVTTWASSKYWIIIVRTKLFNEIRFQGRCLRKINTIEESGGKKYVDSCDVYFRREDKENITINNIENKAVSEELILPERRETGSDFLLPEFRENDLPKKDLISFTLKNWFKPIAENKITLNILGTEISKNNFRNLIQEYSTSNKYLDEEMIDFVIDATNQKNDHLYELKKEIPKNKLYGNTKLTQDLFTDNQIDSKLLADQLYQNKHIQLKVPVRIKTKKGVQFENDFFLVSLKIRDIKKKYPPFGLMFRQYQILWNEKDFWRSARGVNDLMVCVIADKPQLNTVLTHFEEPSHLLFNGRNFSGDDEYEKASAEFILYLFRNAANKFIDFILTGDEKEEPNLLSDLFPVPELDKEERGNNIDDDDDDEEDDDDDDDDDPIGPDKIDPPPPGLEDIIKPIQDGGTFIINSLKNEKIVGKKIKFTFGIRSQKGINPFGNKTNKLTKWDIDLTKVNFDEYEGCHIDITSITFNTFEIMISEDKFKVIFSGLHEAFGYVCKAEIIEVEK